MIVVIEERMKRHSNKVFLLFFLLAVYLLAACSTKSETPSVPPSPTEKTPLILSHTEDKVTLQESTIEWTTYQYELNDNKGILPDSYDSDPKQEKTFNTWVLENKFLRVTLLPEFGGRIISMIYKPTGHEELYQKPVGVPYQIGTGIFYYDWLMVYGGIFPTFPEPEHGKTWFLPWDFEILQNSEQEVEVAMSLKDNIDNPAAPKQYDLGPTGLELTYIISLKAGRAALDTRV